MTNLSIGVTAGVLLAFSGISALSVLGRASLSIFLTIG